MNKPENVLIVMRKQKWILQAPIVISVSMGIQKRTKILKKTNGEQEVKKESKKKTIVVITIVIVVLLIGIGVGIGVFMVHNEKNANVPNNGEIQETQSTAGTETTTPIMKFPNLMQKHISEKILP